MNHFLISNWHHAERDVLRAHVVGTLDFVDLVGLRHDNRVMLQHDSVAINAGKRLCVAILTAHRQVQSKLVGVDDIDIARLGTSKCINSSIEWLVGSDLNGDSCVFAVHAHIICMETQRKTEERRGDMGAENELCST